MKPYRFTKNKTTGITRFLYKAKDIRDWEERGEEFGDSGLILTERNNQVLRYKGYGTKDFPFTEQISFYIVHSYERDGPFIPDKMRCYEEIDYSKFLNLNKQKTA